MNFTLKALTLSLVILSLVCCTGRSDNPPPAYDYEDLYGDAGTFVPAPPDVTPPVITLVSPTTSCISGMVDFEFTAVDAERSVGYISTRFAGVLREVTELGNGTYRFSVDVSPLFEGAHQLVIKAIDLSNNEAIYDSYFGVSNGGGVLHEDVMLCDGPIDEPQPPLPIPLADAGPDTTPPDLAIVQPAADALIGNTPYIQVRVLDQSVPVQITLTIGGRVFEEQANSAFQVFEPDLTGLAEGPTAMSVSATDSANNSASVSQDVRLDLTPPQVRIIEPTAGQDRLALTDVKVCASDSNGISMIILYEEGVNDAIATSSSPLIRNDGTTGPCTADEEEFGLIHELEDTSPLPRNTTFRVVAVDTAGNQGDSEVNIRLLPID